MDSNNTRTFYFPEFLSFFSKQFIRKQFDFDINTTFNPNKKLKLKEQFDQFSENDVLESENLKPFFDFIKVDLDEMDCQVMVSNKRFPCSKL